MINPILNIVLNWLITLFFRSTRTKSLNLYSKLKNLKSLGHWELQLYNQKDLNSYQFKLQTFNGLSSNVRKNIVKSWNFDNINQNDLNNELNCFLIQSSFIISNLDRFKRIDF